MDTATCDEATVIRPDPYLQVHCESGGNLRLVNICWRHVENWQLLRASQSKAQWGWWGLCGTRGVGHFVFGGEQGLRGHQSSSGCSPLLCLAQPLFLLGNRCCSIFRFLCYSAREGGRRALGREEWQDRTTQVLFQVRSEGEKSLFAPGPKTALGVGSNTTAGTTRPAKYS